MLKLFRLLAMIETKEIAKLQAFLESPYFNTRASILQLMQELTPFHPHFLAIKKQNLLSGFRPKDRSHSQFINEQFSALSRLVEQFLVQQELQQNENTMVQLKLQAFQHRKKSDFYIKSFQKITSELEGRSPLHWKDKEYLWLTYHRLHNYFELAEQLPKQTQDLDYLKHLDEYFILVKLRHICNQFAKQAFYAKPAAEHPPEIPFLKAILSEVQHNYPKHAIIQLYVQMVDLFQKWSLVLFEQSEAKFYQIYPKLEAGERYFILLNLVNLANQKMNKDMPDLIQHIFNLYKHGVNNHLFLVNKQLTTKTFLNICIVGAHVGKLVWTDEFIRNHQHLIIEEESDTVVKLGRALLLFHSNLFNEAYDLVYDLSSRQLSRKLRIRTLQVRCLLELHLLDMTYYKVLVATLSNFGQFISRSKQLGETTKQSYRNFNRVVLKIAELRQHNWGQPNAHRELIQYIEQLVPLITRQWLLRKVGKSADE